MTASGFVWVERRRDHPLIDPGLFGRAPFVAAVAGAVAVFVALSVILLLNTVYLQDALGWSPLAAGLATLPLAVGATVCAPLSGILVGRNGARLPLLLGGGFLAAGGILLVAAGTAVPFIVAGYAFVGVGFGFANAPITNTAVQGLSPERAGVAGAITSTARQFGSAIGIALAGALLAGTPDLTTGWIITAACGLVLVAVSRTATTRN